MSSTESTATIAVVDDDEANLKLLVRRLGARGYTVLTFPRGAEALAALGAVEVDLVLLDINMPEMTGYEVCAALQQIDRLRDVPVLFMSAMDDTESKLEAFRQGGRDYIIKPFEFDEVLARVATHVQLYRLQRSLLDARLTAEHASAAKDRFLAMVSHEFRTPLNAIVGMSELLAEQTFGAMNPKQLSYIAFVQESSNQLLQLVNDLLDLACLDFGAMHLDVEEVELVGLVSGVVNSMESLFSAKSLSISLQFEEEHIHVPGDPRKLRQVLFNLLSNAIEYTEPEGTIGIEVRRSAEHTAHVEVSDTGIGISEAELPRIFLNFGSMEMRPDRPSRGKGLGLALARRLILLHGGDIGVRSEQNVGSAFWFSLPSTGAAPGTERRP